MGFILDGLDTEDYDRQYSDRELVRRIIGSSYMTMPTRIILLKPICKMKSVKG